MARPVRIVKSGLMVYIIKEQQRLKKLKNFFI